MKVTVFTLFPEMIKEACRYGLLGTAVDKGLIHLEVLNPRDCAEGVHKAVDDRPYGGSDGMILTAPALEKSFLSAGILPKEERESGKPYPKVIYLSPQGGLLEAGKAEELSRQDFVLLCGRYGGVDQRFLNRFVDEEISIGDYVLHGGELAALVVLDAASRFVPKVLGHSESAIRDSFFQGLLEAPQYTRPAVWQEEEVPEVLREGNHKKQQSWQQMMAVLTTALKRPELLVEFSFSEEGRRSVREASAWFRTLSEKEKEVLGLAELTVEELEIWESEG
jgi:tRNA (guanine37-N1)-methyltransferase